MTTATTTSPATLVRNANEEMQTGYSTWTNDLGVYVWGHSQAKPGWCVLATHAPMETLKYYVRYDLDGRRHFEEFTVAEYGSVGKARAAAFRFANAVSKKVEQNDA